MKFSDLLFVGIKGSVVAISRTTGQQAWATRLKSFDFVNVTVEEKNVYATCRGEIFCLDSLSGKLVWHNPLKGFGLGLATVAIPGVMTSQAAVFSEQQRRDQQNNAAAAA